MKGQISFDLMLAFSVMLILFLAFFQYYSGRLEGERAFSQRLSAQLISDKLASQINAVFEEIGSRSVFAIPKNLPDGSDFQIFIRNRRVEVLFPNGGSSSPIVTSGIVSPDLNLLKGSTIEIKNQGGNLIVGSLP